MPLTLSGTNGLSDVDGSASTPAIRGTDTNTGIFFPAADTIAFAEGGAEAMRIDSSGRVLVGSTSARANFFNATTTTPLQVEGTSFNTASVSTIINSTSDYPFYTFARSRGTTIGSNTIVQSGDTIGELVAMGNDGTEFVQSASISFAIDATPGANDMPGRIVFSTTADGSASTTERMRIDSSGNLLIGTTTQSTGALLTVNGSIKGTITSGTAITLTNQTAPEFLNIPSWARRITVMFSGVSTNGTSNIQIQIGSGSVDATSYTSRSAPCNGSGTTSTTGFLATSTLVAADTINGSMVLVLLSSNIWVSTSAFSLTSGGLQNIGSGTKTLSGTLDRVRITTVNGTDQFDAGTINILYEG